MTDHDERKQQNKIQRKLQANTRNRRQARENACDQITIGFASDWLSRWREFFFKANHKTQ